MPLAAVTHAVGDRTERAFHDFGAAMGRDLSALVGGARPGNTEPLREEEPAREAETSASEPPVATSAAPPKHAKKSHRVRGDTKLFVYVDEKTITELARRRAVPSSKPVPAKGARPAGIALFGVAALGVGLRDGDVLTSVEGRSVQAEGQVIGVVTGVLLSHARRISGEFWRGDRPGAIVVDLPPVQFAP